MAKWGEGIIENFGQMTVSKLIEFLQEMEEKGYGEAVIRSNLVLVSAKSKTQSTMDGDGYATIGYIDVIEEKLTLF